MINVSSKLAKITLGLVVFTGAFVCDDRVASPHATAFVPVANARIGRPLTPLSYAGVARRTTRRAVAARAAVPPPTTVVVAAPTTQTCVDTRNADGSITRVCR
jgi:hypothetical protein